MAVEIRNINLEKGELRGFVSYGIDLYKGNPYYVPPLLTDEVETLMPSKNPAFDFCRAKAFMAYRDGKPVGRILGIINSAVNARTGKQEARFSLVDFIDDDEVSRALFDAVEQWARSEGMQAIVGPMGFTDLDHEGALTFGYDEAGTMATIYNHPYYIEHFRRLGYEPDAEWVEFLVEVPEQAPEKYRRIADIARRKYGLHAWKVTSRKELKERYGHALFRLINEAYDSLYGYSPLTERQIDYYIGKYLGILRLDCISVIVDKEDKLVAVGISMPSLSNALRKSSGRLLPFGWIHFAKALYGSNDRVDLLLIAVAKEYLSKGVNALIFDELVPVFAKHGYKYAETNIELADNENVQRQWQYFNHRQHRRRSSFRKSL